MDHARGLPYTWPRLASRIECPAGGESGGEGRKGQTQCGLLESRKIAYTAHHYPAERMSAVEVAEHIGMPPGQVFKTLVVLPVVSRPRPLLAIIPGDRELDLKKAAAAVGEKKVRMATQNEAESLTRLQVGGHLAVGAACRRIQDVS